MRILLFIILVGITIQTAGQSNGFEFGKITYADLDITVFEQDTSAAAYILDEFGEAYFDLDDFKHIYFEYHIKIKVLKEAGKKYADFEIPLRKDGEIQESLSSIKAMSFNRVGNTWAQQELNHKNIYTEKVTQNLTITKFAVPNVRVGSVIDVYYKFKTPYRYNFIPWRFQWDIPKVRSEFWGKYPAYFSYNITLKGYLSLTKKDFQIIKTCTRSSSFGQGGADCSFFKYAMENIPAFKEEAYMTARRNFEAAVTFELRQVTYPDGQIDKVTNEWKDAERELKEHLDFGLQIKRAKAHFRPMANDWRETIKNPRDLAQTIYSYMKSYFVWNGDLGFLTDTGVKKAIENKSGNVAELNLCLLAALQEVNLEAEPVLLATRSKGLPIRFYPVLSDFNYVLVRVKLDDQYYFLDATSPLNPFGFLPERCLNGQGRALGETNAWIDLKPDEKDRVVSDIRIKLDEQGNLTGSAVINNYGYAAVSKRFDFFSAGDLTEYFKDQKQSWLDASLSNLRVENEDDINKPFVERFDFGAELDVTSDFTYLPIFLDQRQAKNPFTSTTRFYPVDFGATQERIYLINIEYPHDFVLDDAPKNIALALPADGGRLLFNSSILPGNITISSKLTLNKPVYTSEEYHALRELYTRYVTLLQSMIVIKKSK